MLYLILVLAAAASLAEAGEHVFVLRKTDSGVAIEKIPLADGELQVLLSNLQTGYIDIILPVGPGGSGNLARLGEGRKLLARYAAGEIQVTERGSDGKEWERPARRGSDLRDYDIRVSVSGGDGTRKAFLIAGYEQVSADTVGPVIDMFAGRVPLEPGDYVVCTDTYRTRVDDPVHGESPLEYSRYLFARGCLPDGTEGDFLVDVGAGTTVVSKAFLPTNVEIKQAAMVQYSSGVKQMLKYAPEGATGTVQTVLGQATLPELSFGGLRFTDVSVDVLDGFPDRFGRPVAGILGIDLLHSAETLSIDYGTADDSAPSLRLGPRARSARGEVLEMPFSIVNTHVMVKADVEAVPVAFIVDTGAPDCFLDGQAAKCAGVKLYDAPEKTARGLDDGSITIQPAKVRRFGIGGDAFSEVEVFVSPLPIFARMRVHDQLVGLLGNSLLSHFGAVEIDFDRRVVRLFK